MLNSSAVLNGQPAILAWSVTSIQLPPETIQACPINQPIPLYQSQLRSLPLLPPSRSSSLSLCNPSSLSANPLSVPRPHRSGLVPPFDFTLNPSAPFLADCPFHVQPCRSPFLSTVQPRFAYTPIPYAPYRHFFSLSRIYAWREACPFNESPLPDGARRATYIIVKHAMRATGLGIGNATLLHLFVRFFCRSTRAAEVFDLIEVFEQPSLDNSRGYLAYLRY